jgi:hypothetical protein
MTTTALIAVTSLDEFCVDTMQVLSIDAGASDAKTFEGRAE